MKEVINISRPSLLNTIWIYLHRNCTVANNCQTINQSWYVVFHSYLCEQVHIKANDIRANDTCNNTSVVMIDIKMVQYKININRWVFFLGGCFVTVNQLLSACKNFFTRDTSLRIFLGAYQSLNVSVISFFCQPKSYSRKLVTANLIISGKLRNEEVTNISWNIAIKIFLQHLLHLFLWPLSFLARGCFDNMN